MSKKIWVGFLLFVILSASFYIILPDNVRIDVEQTRTKYQVYENNSWVLAAYEYMNVFDGSIKMRAKNRSVISNIVGNLTNITRTANYKDNITTIQTYSFDGNVDNVESVPISQKIECINCQGKIVHFEYRDIEYVGITTDIVSPFAFGYKMKLEWQEGAYRAKVYQQISSDKIIIRYRPVDDYEIYLVRLFDPELVDDSNDNIKIIDDVKYELLCTPIIVDIKSTENYPCNKTIKIPIYENITYSYLSIYNESCKSIVNVNKTDFCNISYLAQTIVGYSEDIILSECIRDIIIKEERCINTGEVKVDDTKIVKDDYYFLGVDSKGIIGDECKDSHGGGADSNCDSICQKGETCVRYKDGKFERYQ